MPPDARRSGNPARRAAAGSTPRPQGLRDRVSRPSRGVLAVLARLPLWAIPAVILVLMVVGLAAPLVYAVPALIVVAGFIGWLAYLSWPVLTPRGRLLRAVMIALVAGSAAARSTGLM